MITRNRVKCKKCCDIIESKHRCDYVLCSCGAIGVDGGLDYLRRTGNSKDIEELSEHDSSHYGASEDSTERNASIKGCYSLDCHDGPYYCIGRSDCVKAEAVSTLSPWDLFTKRVLEAPQVDPLERALDVLQKEALNRRAAESTTNECFLKIHALAVDAKTSLGVYSTFERYLVDLLFAVCELATLEGESLGALVTEHLDERC